MYLPDTNIFIRALHDIEPEATFLKKIISKRQLIISVIVIAEFYPRANTQELRSFNQLLDDFEIISVNRDSAEIAGNYRKGSLKQTRSHLLDCFLAAQAKIHNLTLVTNNKSDFPMKDIKIISP